MTPEEVDALLHRIPPPAPSPRLRERVVEDIGRRILSSRRTASPRRCVWGGLALASGLAGFASILWFILPQAPVSTSPAPGGVGQGEPKTGFGPTVWSASAGSREISRMTVSPHHLFVERSDGTISSMDRFTGKSLWVSRFVEGVTPDWPPVAAQGVPEEIDRLEESIRALGPQIDAKLNEGAPAADVDALQARRNLERERLRVAERGDNVYLIFGRLLHCVRRRTGQLEWTRQLSFAPSGAPFARRGTLYIPEAANRRVWVLDVERNGAEAMNYQGRGALPENPVIGGPEFHDPLVYFVAPEGTLHCYRVTGGRESWSYPAAAGRVGGLKVQILRSASGIVRLAVFSVGRWVYAMDGDAGVLLWKHDCGGDVQGTPWIDGQSVVVRTDAGTMIALEAMPGKLGVTVAGRIRWQLEGADRILTNGRSGVFVLSRNQEILVVNGKTGEITARHRSGPLNRFLTNPHDGLLYAVKPGGEVTCFGDRK